MNKPSIDDKCSKYFKYRNYLECSDTYKKTLVNNIPNSIKTFHAIKLLSNNILDKVQEKFGNVTLTYGFCGSLLKKEIKKNIYPKLDQHSGCELNKQGELICDRKGFAADFHVENECSLDVARWIVENCLFDRLYFYGKKNPIHVSFNNNPIQSIILMKFKKIRKVPEKIKKEVFLNSEIDF